MHVNPDNTNIRKLFVFAKFIFTFSVNTGGSYRVAFFNGSTFIEPKMSIHLTGEAVQTNKWDIPAEATKVYLSALLAPDGVNVHDPSIRIKYEFGDQATPWTPAPIS